MIDSLGRELLGFQKGREKRSRATVKIDNTPIKNDETPTTNSLVRYTDFFYTLRFQPSVGYGIKDKPFLIKSDIFIKGRMRVKNYVGLMSLAQTCPEVKWLVENCDITPALFAFAQYDSCVDFPIRFKMVEYCVKLQKQIPNCPKYYPVLKEYDEAIAEVRRWEDYLIKKGEMTEEERFKEI